ncbi:hypothetical protein GDO86_014638 [Hymenochirus boettgeri]|uniref:COMM domain-containing protein n=1 Tax=Hymenochirus boettgeri TaxID=247094 RepID=A0A8T2JY15_9PIPI|nr:hypothetical protein GDO86_014638 [Hymenochirus boettgeri]
MSLTCFKGPLPDSAVSDMQNLRQFSGEQVAQLSTIIFGCLKEQKELEHFTSQLEDFAKSYRLGLGPLKSIARSILLILNGAQKKNLNAEQLQIDLAALGLDEEKTSYFVHQWNSNLPLLTRIAVERTLAINQLVDMEWKFGVTAANSETEKAGSIFLQLKIAIRRGNHAEPFYIELTLPQFYSFLHEMERAKSNLECLST